MAHYYMPGEGNTQTKPQTQCCRLNFDQHHTKLVTSEEEGGWRAEMQQYLKECPKNVSEDIDGGR